MVRIVRVVHFWPISPTYLSIISITPEKDLKGSTRLVREALRGVELTDGDALFSLPLGVPSRVTSGSKTDVWPSKLKQFVNIARYWEVSKYQDSKSI